MPYTIVMRVLGVDYGERKIGLAKAALGTPAVPLLILENRGRKKLLAQLSELCTREGITEVVVGLPVSLGGKSTSDTASAVNTFVRALEQQTSLPVHLVDERLTTRAAQRLQDDSRQPDDAVAAMLILQSWIDNHHPAGGGIP